MLQQAIHADLNILDTVIAKEVGYHDVAEELLTEYPPGWIHLFYRRCRLTFMIN